MKKLITTTITLLLIVSATSAQKLKESTLNVHTFWADNTTVFCGKQDVKYRVKNRRIILLSKVAQFDLKIIKKNVGEYDSWIGQSKDKQSHYFITPLLVNGAMAIMLQPIDMTNKKNEDGILRAFHEPIAVFTAAEICK